MAETNRSLVAIPDELTATSISTCHHLAAYFGVDLRTLTQLIGGDWRPVDDRRLRPLLPEPARWLGAGTPLQVLLGISDTSAIVAKPDEFVGGLAGPPTIDATDPLKVDMSAATRPLIALGLAVEQTLARTRHDWAWCQGCRQCLPVGAMSGMGGLWCQDCRQTYLGVIVC